MNIFKNLLTYFVRNDFNTKLDENPLNQSPSASVKIHSYSTAVRCSAQIAVSEPTTDKVSLLLTGGTVHCAELQETISDISLIQLHCNDIWPSLYTVPIRSFCYKSVPETTLCWFLALGYIPIEIQTIYTSRFLWPMMLVPLKLLCCHLGVTAVSLW